MKEKFVSIYPANYKLYLRNALFDHKKIIDYWNLIFIHLKKTLKKNKININTYDIPTRETPYKYVYLDLPYIWDPRNFPVWKNIFLNKRKNILLCQEPPTIIPFNYMKIFHFLFAKIYTWNDDLVDNKQVSSSSKKYFKMLLPKHTNGINTKAKKFRKKKFLTLINTNMAFFYPFKLLNSSGKELYSERIKAIEFFEKNIPDKFYLYGRGWNRAKKYSLKEAIFGYKKYCTYKGEAKDKIKLLSIFKYCLCFENSTNVKGYITEKIFDCFKARCVPIYWGASNIENYIPKDCFIDFRNFGNYEKLLNFLNSIDEGKYNRYIKNIEKLLGNKEFKAMWFEDGYADFFLKDVLETQKFKN